MPSNQPQTTAPRPDYEAAFDGRCMCGENGTCPACDGEGCALCGDDGRCPECGGTGILKDEYDD